MVWCEGSDESRYCIHISIVTKPSSYTLTLRGILLSMSILRRRRVVGLVVAIMIAISAVLTQPQFYQPQSSPTTSQVVETAITDLERISVKGRAPKTGYSRAQFGDGWRKEGVCDTRNIILNRDLRDVVVDEQCKVQKGTLADPYTGGLLEFRRGPQTSQLIQIDHVVALSNAWQTGAQQLTFAQRENLANDALNLLAVDGAANQQKSDGDAATWLPSNKAFRCQYVSRQLKVKVKYELWVTPGEKQAMKRVLAQC